MRLEPISKNSKAIVDTMRDLIARGVTKHSNKTTSGWRYEGDDFTKSVDDLHKSLQTELQPQGFHVNEPLSFIFQTANQLSRLGGRLHSASFLPRSEYPEPELSYQTIINHSN